MPRGLIGRGDLLRALIQHAGGLSPQAVEALGYSHKPPDTKSHLDVNKRALGYGKQASKQESETLLPEAPPAPVPFWQPVRYVPDEIEHPDIKKGTAPAWLPNREPSSPPPYRYLASFKQLVPRLRAALSEHRASRSYDIPRIVSQIGRGKILVRLPRRHRSGWGSSLYVIEDRSNHLAPYVRDQAMVQHHLRQLYQSIGFHPAIYNECQSIPQVFWADGRVSPIQPQAGDQVLVLGDLGCLAQDGGRATLFWYSFGEELRDLGVSAFALLPCAPAECPQTVADYYHLLSWEHPAPQVFDEEQLEAYGEQIAKVCLPMRSLPMNSSRRWFSVGSTMMRDCARFPASVRRESISTVSLFCVYCLRPFLLPLRSRDRNMKASSVGLAQIADWHNLASAFHRAAKGKGSRDEVCLFRAYLFNQLASLRYEILDGTIEVGRMRRFRIRDPKPRIIHAPCFRERVLHHALMAFVGPVLERALVYDTYACRPGKGALAAVRRAQQHLRRFPWYVKIDIRAYFASIDHQVLYALLQRRFKNTGLLDLMRRIIDAHQVAPHKGLPIGALTSQQFANYYLSGLDRRLLEECHVRGFVRYMDDLVWWGDDKVAVRKALDAAHHYTDSVLRLQMKTPIQVGHSRNGLSFCGYRILPGRLLLSRRRKRRYAECRHKWEQAFAAGMLDQRALQAGYDSARAITSHADAEVWRREQLRRQPLANSLQDL